jgi:glycosyltransferase involved in cell wall biosynthesis
MIQRTYRDQDLITEPSIVRPLHPRLRGSAPRQIAIDVRMANAPGIGTYLRNLLPQVIAARPSWRFTLFGAPAVIESEHWNELTNVVVQEIDAPIYSVREQIALRAARGRRFDAFWCPHYNIPLSISGPLLVSVHDVIHLARPEYTGNAAKRWYARLMFEMVRRRATAILTCSEFTRQEFLRLAGPTRARFTVAPYGVDTRWFQDAPAASQTVGHGPQRRPYVVCVGSLKPHKNVGALISAFATLLDRIPHDLVIVGRAEGLRTADAEAVKSSSAFGDRIRFAGEISDAALRALVAGASALAHPSLYEGFGFPPLEAMAAGVPCVVSRAASLPEVCGEAVLYCDASKPADIASQLYRLLTDDRLSADLSKRGRARATTFRWNPAVDATLDALDYVLTARAAPVGSIS